MKIIAVIPAHMASVRFPGKILFNFHGLPMIEHVRRRALLSRAISDVIVATCDEDIASVIRSFGGRVVMTTNTHKNGTSRVAEAIKEFDCTHVILLQGDEPLLLPRHIDTLADAILANPSGDAWNATGPIESYEELDRHSFVKCAISQSGRIMHCFRRTPSQSSFEQQLGFVRKILGIIAYRKDFLMKITSMSSTQVELADFIEQMRILENDYSLQSVPVNPSVPSVNEPHEADIVLEYMHQNPEQKALLEKILGQT
jgi:3-deoxy-manno-octulosonate cytidylyltransferase (CMP-KDO synthetase)